MNPLGVRALFLPLILVALLSTMLGYFVARAVSGDRPEQAALVSVVAVPATPTAAPPSPTQTPASGRTPRTSRTERNCPAGCECQFPPGGTVVVCHGGSVTIP